MKIGVVSDSHGKHKMIDWMLAHPVASEVEMWFFAGDVAQDAEYLLMMSDKPVVKVAGNNDWPVSKIPEESVTDVAGHRIFLTHGHTYGVNFTTDILEKTAREVKADIAIYGHTHIADINLGEITIVNPGSIAMPRDASRGSFMVIELLPAKTPNVKLIRI